MENRHLKKKHSPLPENDLQFQTRLPSLNETNDYPSPREGEDTWNHHQKSIRSPIDSEWDYQLVASYRRTAWWYHWGTYCPTLYHVWRDLAVFCLAWRCTWQARVIWFEEFWTHRDKSLMWWSEGAIFGGCGVENDSTEIITLINGDESATR